MNAFEEVDESDYDSEEESKGGTGMPEGRSSLTKAERRSLRMSRTSMTNSENPDSANQSATGGIGGRSSMPRKSALQTALEKAKGKHEFASGDKIKE